MRLSSFSMIFGHLHNLSVKFSFKSSYHLKKQFYSTLNAHNKCCQHSMTLHYLLYFLCCIFILMTNSYHKCTSLCLSSTSHIPASLSSTSHTPASPLPLGNHQFLLGVYESISLLFICLVFFRYHVIEIIQNLSFSTWLI